MDNNQNETNKIAVAHEITRRTRNLKDIPMVINLNGDSITKCKLTIFARDKFKPVELFININGTKYIMDCGTWRADIANLLKDDNTITISTDMVLDEVEVNILYVTEE